MSTKINKLRPVGEEEERGKEKKENCAATVALKPQKLNSFRPDPFPREETGGFFFFFMKGCSMTGASFEEDHYALLSAWRNLTVDKVSVAVRMKAVRSVSGCNQEDA